MGRRWGADSGRVGHQRYRRTQITAAASIGVLGLSVLLAPSGVAQQPGSEPETGEIRNGTAKAVATVAKVAPGVGDLALAITMGTSVTQITNDLAQATSRVGDLGLIGSSLTGETCDGSTVLTPEQLPQATSVDNRGGDAAASRDEAGSDGSPLAGGRMHAEATKDIPTSLARTTMSAIGSADAVQIGAGTSETITRVLPGEGREAVATVTSSIDLGGVLQLEGLRWSAHHRTGVAPLAVGSFEIGRAAADGVPLPTEDLAAVEDGLNTVLAQTGITIDLPRVQRIIEPADFIRVTPLRIEMRDSPLGKTVLGPVLDVTREQRVELFNSLVAAACQLSSVLLVGDVGVSVLAGTGFLTVEIGGVEASSSDLEIGNPFGTIAPFDPSPATPATGGVDLGGTTPRAAVATGGVSPPSTVAGSGPVGERALASRPASAVVELCESLHPNGDECSEGAAAAVGAAGLAATIAMAGADVVRQRRRSTLEEI